MAVGIYNVKFLVHESQLDQLRQDVNLIRNHTRYKRGKKPSFLTFEIGLTRSNRCWYRLLAQNRPHNSRICLFIMHVSVVTYL